MWKTANVRVTLRTCAGPNSIALTTTTPMLMQNRVPGYDDAADDKERYKIDVGKSFSNTILSHRHLMYNRKDESHTARAS